MSEQKRLEKCIMCFIDNGGKCTAKCKLSGLERQAQLFQIKSVLEEA